MESIDIISVLSKNRNPKDARSDTPDFTLIDFSMFEISYIFGVEIKL